MEAESYIVEIIDSQEIIHEYKEVEPIVKQGSVKKTQKLEREASSVEKAVKKETKRRTKKEKEEKPKPEQKALSGYNVFIRMAQNKDTVQGYEPMTYKDAVAYWKTKKETEYKGRGAEFKEQVEELANAFNVDKDPVKAMEVFTLI